MPARARHRDRATSMVLAADMISASRDLTALTDQLAVLGTSSRVTASPQAAVLIAAYDLDMAAAVDLGVYSRRYHLPPARTRVSPSLAVPDCPRSSPARPGRTKSGPSWAITAGSLT